MQEQMREEEMGEGEGRNEGEREGRHDMETRGRSGAKKGGAAEAGENEL